MLRLQATSWMVVISGANLLKLSNHYRAEIAMVLVTLLAAFGWIFSKEALAGLPPWLFIGLRFLLAGTVLLIAGHSAWSSLRTPGVLRHCFGFGLVMAVAMLAWILGLHHGKHLGEGAFITSMGVVLVPVIARVFFGERPPRSTWLALPVAVAGLACLSLEDGFRPEVGQLWFLGAACVFAVHFSLISHRAPAIPTILLTATQLLVVGAAGLLISLLSEDWPASVAAPVWGWLLASALIATSLRFGLQTYGQSLTPASHAALIMVLEPVWTAVLALLWFAEGMHGLQLLGCMLILGAMLISRWRWVRGLLLRGRKSSG